MNEFLPGESNEEWMKRMRRTHVFMVSPLELLGCVIAAAFLVAIIGYFS